MEKTDEGEKPPRFSSSPPAWWVGTGWGGRVRTQLSNRRKETESTLNTALVFHKHSIFIPTVPMLLRKAEVTSLLSCKPTSTPLTITKIKTQRYIVSCFGE